MLRGSRKRAEGDGGEVPYAGLRRLALDAAREGQPVKRAHRDVFGLIADIPSGDGFVTIVALADDTTSMYTSVGGGTLGAGTHPTVAAATHELLARVQAQLGDFQHSDDDSLPDRKVVRLHVATRSGMRRADVPAECFWGELPHPLTPVLAGIQGVIAGIRAVQPSG